MFGGVNVWQITKLKFGKWIDFGHKDTIYVSAKIWLVKD